VEALKLDVPFQNQADLNMKHIASPLNYIGGKYKLLEQIMPLIPDNIKTFVDLFAGGFNVGININADKIIGNEYVFYITNLYKEIQGKKIEDILSHIDRKIKKYALSKTNEEGYKKLRNDYNETRKPLDLYVLICYSFNYQIRFNANHEYNNPFGRDRSCFTESLRKKLEEFKERIDAKNIEFTSFDFRDFIIDELDNNDFVYADPPYLITNGSYVDGKRGFKGWGRQDEVDLLNLLDSLNKKGVRFALSNVLEHKGQKNDILVDWSKCYNINYLNYNYSNSSYQCKNRDKNSTIEVLITNY
jgi:DNA adenine methylase Dam